MKRILFIAALFAAAAISTPATAGKKKDKKKVQTETVEQAAPVEPVVVLADQNDTLNYAAGVNATRGLLQYIQNKFGVDNAHMPIFIEGLKEGLDKADNAEFKARAAGYQIAEVVKQNILANVDKEIAGTTATFKQPIFMQGFFDAVKGDSTVFTLKDASMYYQEEMTELKRVRDERYKKENEEWLAENAKQEGIVTTESGLQYRVVKMGTGAVAESSDKVTVKYEGKLIDGTVFDSSYTRTPDTSTFSPKQVIAGWNEALTKMPAGSVWELYIPENLGYGSRQAGKIPPYSTLIFTVEVVSVSKAAETAPATSKNNKR